MAADRPGLLLRDGSVFDSSQRTFIPGVSIRCGATFEALGPGVAASEGDEVLDCSGRFVLPGLIDCHVHLASSGAANEAAISRDLPLAQRVIRAERHAEATLRAGFTLVRDLGAADHINIHLAAAIEEGHAIGPTILAAGMGVTMTGGHGHTGIARQADGPDDVRKAVREQLRAGAQVIKLFASGGVMTKGVNPQSPSFTEDELRAGVEEAHKAFRVVGAHAQATDGIKNAVRAGVDSIEHGIWLDDEAIELMLGRGTYLVPTLSAPTQIGRGGLEAGIQSYVMEKQAIVVEDHLQSYRKAVQAGVLVAAGTDQGTPLNKAGENAREMILMAQHALSPAAAILAGSAWAAELLRLADKRGRLAEGLIADAVVVARDPLEDIASLANPENIIAVIKDGRVVHRNDRGGTT
jgi:imidazolonepropionase-like amidohydrolase